MLGPIYPRLRCHSAASFISGPSEWELKYSEIQNRDSTCEQLKGEVELRLKNSVTNITALDWIGKRKGDPEPLHQTVKERTGVDDPSSTGGEWFLQTSEFSSWVDGIRQNTAKHRVFWLKGSSTCFRFLPNLACGRTNLLKNMQWERVRQCFCKSRNIMSDISIIWNTNQTLRRCRAISHFNNSPVVGVRFVPYYCHGSGSSPGPKYETIIRALCRRLAWNSDGKVAEEGMQLYESSKSDPEAQVTMRKTWEPLFHELIASSSATIVLILDALDECDSIDHYMMLLEFLNKVPRGTSGPYILVSSQPHVPVGDFFDGSVKTFDVVQSETRNDMRNFIEHQITAKSEQIRWRKGIFCE